MKTKFLTSLKNAITFKNIVCFWIRIYCPCGCHSAIHWRLYQAYNVHCCNNCNNLFFTSNKKLKQITMRPNTITDTWQNRVDKVRALKKHITTQNKLVQANYIINQLNRMIHNRYKAQT